MTGTHLIPLIDRSYTLRTLLNGEAEKFARQIASELRESSTANLIGHLATGKWGLPIWTGDRGAG